MMRDELGRQPKKAPRPGMGKWLYDDELDVYQNVRRFVMVAAGATSLHFVTDWLEHHLHAYLVFMLRLVEYSLFVGDIFLFLLSIVIGVIIKTRELFLLLNIDIFRLLGRWR